MGFKLGTERGLEAIGGEIKTKMRFGKQAGDVGSVPGTPVIRVPLDEGVMGEANMDGTIYVNRNITGAVVGVQPFGGRGLSGTGPKAGGPNYLMNLLKQKIILNIKKQL